MKKFLLGALGALGFLGQLAAQEPASESQQAAPMAATATEIPEIPAATATDTPVAAVKDTPAPAAKDTPAAVDFNGRNGKCWRLYGGGELLFLRPHHDSDPAFTTTTTIPAFVNGNVFVKQETRANTTEFTDKFGTACRFWLGVQGEHGLGGRARWFHYDNSDSVTGNGNQFPSANGFINVSVSTPSGNLSVPGAQNIVDGVLVPLNRPLEVSRRLDIDTWDAEVTKVFENSVWNCMLAAGVRYGYIEQRYNARIPGVAATETFGGVPDHHNIRTGTEESRNQFTGAGPTIALDVLRRLGDSQLALYGNVRGSLLCGRGHLRSHFNVNDHFDQFDAAGNVIATADFITRGSSSTSGFDLLPIVELEAGLQWSRPLGNVEVFVRPSVISQTYFGGGSATARTGDFGLFGFVVAAGVSY